MGGQRGVDMDWDGMGVFFTNVLLLACVHSCAGICVVTSKLKVHACQRFSALPLGIFVAHFNGAVFCCVPLNSSSPQASGRSIPTH
jgi:hypothetical protein